MTTTLREILREYADTGSLDAEYVPIAEYEALQLRADNTITKRDEHIKDMQTENEALLTLLRQWVSLENNLIISTNPSDAVSFHLEKINELKQLITATKAALDAQLGNNPSTSRQSD